MTLGATFDEIVEAVREHTAELLGTTISFDESDWAAETALSGWTRSHIAAHLAEDAERMAAFAKGANPRPFDRGIARCRWERRALAAGLALQTALDKASGQLQALLPKLDSDDREFLVNKTFRLPASQLPLLRLREIIIHHFDFIGDDALSLPLPLMLKLLELEISLPKPEPLPPALLIADEGFSARIGDTNLNATTLIGPALDLFLWLARGRVTQRISGLPSH